MTDPCGSVTELHSMPKRSFHEDKKKKLVIWVGRYQVASTWQKLSR